MRTCSLVVNMMAVLGFAGCGSDDSESSEIGLSTMVLECPSDTLTLSIEGGFPAGTTVEFEMGDTQLDGDPVELANGSIACGLPSNAAPGTYEVLVDGASAGSVTLKATGC